MQVLTPFSGSNSIPCGMTSQLMDHAGNSNYSDYAEGYTVIYAGDNAQITINGTYQVESCCDRIYIYDGVGTGGTLLQTIGALGSGNVNYTGTPGQTLTVRFYSDVSVQGSGFDFMVTFANPCYSTACVTTPPANSVLSPTYAVCPNTSLMLMPGTTYTQGGITYQWLQSTSTNIGPFTPAVNTSTNYWYTTPSLTTTTWYQLVATCSNGGNSYTTSAGQVSVSPVIVDNVPYFEGFEGIVNTNQLPNCSWSRSALAGTPTYTAPNTNNRVPRTGNNFASFYYSPAGTNYFYTNGIQLYAGVTYSAAMWFTTEYFGYNTWNLSMMIGNTQTPAGLTSIASLTYAASPNYRKLDNTFTVPTSGIYYVAIRAISNGVCCGNYLSWDDLSITIPCSLNQASVSINAAGSTTVCLGQSVNLTASGANTYTWNTGATTANITDIPSFNTIYTATGTNTLTNCQAMASQSVIVRPVPLVSIVPSTTAVCEGGSVNLIAFGANSYTWNPTGGNGPMVSVMPTNGASTFSVLGGNQYNCTSQAIQAITVNQLPGITAQSSRPAACVDEPITLTGFGGTTYQWMSNTNYVQGSPIMVSPNIGTTIYTLSGTDANGCTNTVTVIQDVFRCTGLNELAGTLPGLNVFPNPNSGAFNIELHNGLTKTIEMMDVTGRMIFTQSSAEGLIPVNVSHLANGVYYVRVKSDSAVEILKVVKQ